MSTEAPDDNSIHVSEVEKGKFKATKRQMQVDLDRDLSQRETVSILCELYNDLDNPTDLVEE